MSDIDQEQGRAKILLRAARDILHKCDETPYVEDALSTTAFYDSVERDGACLKEEIEILLGIDSGEKPLGDLP